MISNQTICIVIPAFNEKKRLGGEEYFRRILISKNVFLCFVNDGSTDGSLQVLISLSSNFRGTCLDLKKNVGKSEAIRAGFFHVNSQFAPEFFAFLDADSAFSAEAVRSILTLAMQKFKNDTNCSAFLSSRISLSGRKIQRSTFRHYISRILITLIGFTVPNLPYDSQSGLKIFRNSPELRNAMSKPFKTRWFFDIELLIRTNWLASGKVWEEPVLEWRDVAGSHLSLRNAPRLIVEIFRVMRMGRNSRKKS